MIDGRGIRITHRRQLTVTAEQMLRHEQNEYRPHAVEAVSLRNFVGDDVGNTAWHGPARNRRGQIRPLAGALHADFQARAV